jgi:uncharacterized membrane protein YczE
MHAAPRRALAARVALVLVGSLLSSYGYLMTVRADVGNGPMFAMQDALHVRTGMSLALTAIVAGLALAVLARVLGIRLGIGPLGIPLVTGVTVAALEPFAPHLEGALLRWAAFGVGTTVMMLGAVVMFRAEFGGSALESAMFGVARVTRTSAARARIGLEITMALVGFAFGGRVGLGTAAMAISVGPLFAFWCRRLPPIVAPAAGAAPAAQAPAMAEGQSGRRRALAISRAASRSD